MMNENKFRRLEANLLLAFSLVFVISTVVAITLLTSRSNQTLRKYVSGLVTANGRQIELNIDNYMQGIEKAASLLFSEENNLDYEKSNSSIPEYRRIQIETAIHDQILNLSLMENFSDFAILYSDGTQIGWISKNTAALYPDGDLYEVCASKIQDSKAQDSWSFGYQENFSRVYYAKRLNPSAIIFASFYGSELASAFEVPRELQNMTIRLTDEEGQIVYSTTTNEIGTYLPESVTALLEGENVSVQTAMNEELLVTENVCKNNWKVYGTISTESLLGENRALYRRTLASVILLMMVAVAIIGSLYLRYSRRLNHMVGEISDRANTDLMTGLLNKSVFAQVVTEDLKKGSDKQAFAFMMFDIDNFKTVNDQLGHATGDVVICCMADSLRSSFPKEMRIGRIGGDEFAVYGSYDYKDCEAAEAELRIYVEKFYETFREKAREIGDGVFISASSGIAVTAPGKYNYDRMYQMADQLLYISKEHGKDTPTYASEVPEDLLQERISAAAKARKEGGKR